MRIENQLELVALPVGVWVVQVCVWRDRWEKLPPLLICPTCRLSEETGDLYGDVSEGLYVASMEHVEFMRARHDAIWCAQCSTPLPEDYIWPT